MTITILSINILVDNVRSHESIKNRTNKTMDLSIRILTLSIITIYLTRVMMLDLVTQDMIIPLKIIRG